MEMQTSVPAYQAGENETHTQSEREKGEEGERERETGEFKKSGEMSIPNEPREVEGCNTCPPFHTAQRNLEPVISPLFSSHLVLRELYLRVSTMNLFLLFCAISSCPHLKPHFNQLLISAWES